ncbi:H-NS family nucleoid-associated regulatory protein [Cupriavidus necator]
MADREWAIRWIRARMALYDLTLADLHAAGCFTPRRQPCYRNALGQSWDGRGPMPEWLQRAVNAGQSPEFYRVV